MKLQQATRLIIGGMVFTSALLGYTHSPNWLWFTMFVGLNLMQFSITGFCPLVIMLKRAGLKE